MKPTPRCTATKADGTRCTARPRTGSAFCFFHDPDAATARDAARRAGGQERSRRAATLGPDAPDLPLKTVADVVGLLGATINQVRRGDLDPRISNAVGYLAGTLLKALEQGDIETRLDTLERIVNQQPVRPTALDDAVESFTFQNPAA